jgi:hypothetical protein
MGTLAAALVAASSKDRVFKAIERVQPNQKDIPFALVYLFEEGDSRLRLAARDRRRPRGGRPLNRPRFP